MNYYERHIGDYLKDTAHLSLLHHGIYSRLMDVYYTREHGFSEGEAHRLIGARSKDERTATDEVLAEFFVSCEGVWIQDRCDREIARYREKQEKARRSAEARWSESGRNANAFHSGDAKGMRTHSEGNALQSPDTSLQSTSHLPVAPARPADEPPALALVETSKSSVPDCPHQAILALWAEVLPALPQHTKWTASRAEHLRARWRESAVENSWQCADDGIAFFRRLFVYVGKSRFLTGRAYTAPGKQPFVVELAWLLLPDNFAKLIEGKYHSEAA